MDDRPAAEYARRLDARRTTYAELERRDRRLAYSRLWVFVAGAAVAVLAWQGLVSAWLVLAPAAGFLLLITQHDRVLRAKATAVLAIDFYERGLSRIDDTWMGRGESGDRFRDDAHPYANDLDLFGRGSLFELLSTARTKTGEEILAHWLRGAATPHEIALRQQAVRELAPSLDLREALVASGSEIGAKIDGPALVAWAGASASLPPWVRSIARLLTAAVVVSIAVLFWSQRSELLLIALAVQMLCAWTWVKPVERSLHAADPATRELGILAHLLERLERERFTAPRLEMLRQQLFSDGQPASHAIRSLHRLVEMHDWQHNVLFIVPSMVVLWGTHVACAIEAWRRTHARDVAAWLASVGEVEALASLSAYHYEHPEDIFPHIVRDADARHETLFDGEGLGHPLIPQRQMVRNDVRLTSATPLWVVSGSNMSGKSTLLRTVGVNTVLALAGAPVRAWSLRLSPLAVGATLRIQDSLQEGRSRFYAEITRIRQLAETAAGGLPLLFLLDELFQGTNSHDRLVGASGVLRSFIDKGAIGLITTHDLALTAIAEELGPRAVNVHFEDWFEGGDMRFDYSVKAGPVTRSNAIALMRAVGLDVGDA